MELFGLGVINNWEETMKQWAFINRFMDKTQSLPREPLSIWESIQWFAERGLTFETIMQVRGSLENDESGDWFKWDEKDNPKVWVK